MAVMGDASAEVWAEELRRTGRVVFPQRPRAMALNVIFGGWACVSVGPADVWAKDLTLRRDNVRDVVAFAHWLEELLKEQRRLAAALRLPPGRGG